MASSSGDEWMQLILKAKELTKKGQLEMSLAVYRKALAFRHDDRLVRRIKKIEVKIRCYYWCSLLSFLFPTCAFCPYV